MNRIEHMPVADTVQQCYGESIENARHFIKCVEIHRNKRIEGRGRFFAFGANRVEQVLSQ